MFGIDAHHCIEDIGTPTAMYYSKENKWVTLSKFPPLPAKENVRYSTHSICNANGELYVARSRKVSPLQLKHTQFLKLDVDNNKWVELSPMKKRRSIISPVKKKRGACSMVFLDGRIYAFGCPTDGDQRCGEVYDIKDNSWRILPSMPKLIKMPASCVAYAGKILVYGANDVSTDSDRRQHFLLMYDPLADSWSVLMDVSHPLSSVDPATLVVHNGKCFRVVRGKCLCQADECTDMWHLKISVHELIVDFKDRSAIEGQRQDDRLEQTPIAGDPRFQYFYIDRDVYFFFVSKVYNTGVKVDDDGVNEVLRKRHRGLKTLNKVELDYCEGLLFTHFMFDKAIWL